MATTSTEILKLERAFWDAMQSEDSETAMKLVDETSIVAGPQGAASMDRKTLGSMMHSDRWTLHGYEFVGEPTFLQPTPDTAVIAYKVREDLTVEGKPVTIEAAETSTWVQRKGKWLCVLHTESLLGDPFGRDRVANA